MHKHKTYEYVEFNENPTEIKTDNDTLKFKRSKKETPKKQKK